MAKKKPQAPSPVAAPTAGATPSAHVKSRARSQRFDLWQGVFFTSILAVICGVAVCKSGITPQKGILFWLAFLLLSGICIRLPKTNKKLALRWRAMLLLGFPAAVTLFLTSSFISLGALFASVSISAPDGTWEYVQVPFASFGTMPVYREKTPHTDKVADAERSLPSSAPREQSSAIVLVLAVNSVMSLLTAIGIMVCAYCRQFILDMLSVSSLETMTSFEHRLTVGLRVVSVAASAIGAALL